MLEENIGKMAAEQGITVEDIMARVRAGHPLRRHTNDDEVADAIASPAPTSPRASPDKCSTSTAASPPSATRQGSAADPIMSFTNEPPRVFGQFPEVETRYAERLGVRRGWTELRYPFRMRGIGPTTEARALCRTRCPRRACNRGTSPRGRVCGAGRSVLHHRRPNQQTPHGPSG